MKYLIAIILSLWMCAGSNVQSANNIQIKLRKSFKSEKEEVLAVLEDGKIVELTKNNNINYVNFDHEKFRSLCLSEKSFLLVHSHVHVKDASSFPSPRYELDGIKIGDFGTTMNFEYQCEMLAVQKKSQRAKITHALYDVDKDVLVYYGIGKDIMKRMREIARKDDAQQSFTRQYGTSPLSVSAKKLAFPNDIAFDRENIFILINVLYENAYNAHFTERCRLKDCSDVNIWEFAKEFAYLSHYFTVTPCRQGEMCDPP